MGMNLRNKKNYLFQNRARKDNMYIGTFSYFLKPSLNIDSNTVSINYFCKIKLKEMLTTKKFSYVRII